MADPKPRASHPPRPRAATSRLPAFIIIGSAKSGTSTLARYLARHPALCCSREKEPCFFDRDVGWKRGWDWYASMFEEAKEGQLCYEASTNYTRYPEVLDVPRRIYANLPDAKLIYILRHPVDRAYSHYVHRYTRELHPGEPITTTFEQHIETDPMCVHSSDYSLQIDQYLEYFPRDSLLLLRFRDLKNDPSSTLRRVLRFLDVDDTIDLAAHRIAENAADRQIGHLARAFVMAPLREAPILKHVKRYVPERVKRATYEFLKQRRRGREIVDSVTPRPMRPETRASLVSMFERSNAQLAKAFRFDVSGWDH